MLVTGYQCKVGRYHLQSPLDVMDELTNAVGWRSTLGRQVVPELEPVGLSTAADFLLVPSLSPKPSTTDVDAPGQ